MRSRTRGWGRRGSRILALALACAAPVLAAAEFRCDQSVEAHATWCTGSQITSIPQRDAAAACRDFTRRLGQQCRADWDQFKDCREFAGRFERLLVESCRAQKVPKKSCQQWGEAFLVGPQTRCQRGRFRY